MVNWRVARKLLFFYCLVFSTPAFSQEGLTESQSLILRQTLSAGGSITKEMHTKFWADVPKVDGRTRDPMVLFLLRSTTLGQTYQRALWQSALISYDQKAVIRTESLGESERAYSKYMIESAPFKMGSPEHSAFEKAYKARAAISIEHSKRLLEAAASHQNLVAVDGTATKIDDNVIRTVLAGLDASFERMKLLVNPVWKGR